VAVLPTSRNLCSPVSDNLMGTMIGCTVVSNLTICGRWNGVSTTCERVIKRNLSVGT
jgi:hypothetical protein